MNCRWIKNMGFLAYLCAGLLGFGLLPQQAAAAYPDRATTLVISWPAGGATDMLGRMLASAVEKNLGQKVNEKNFRLARAGECGSAMAIGTEEIDGREEVNKKGKGGDYAQRL